jgi:hypothetical protein
MPDAGRKGRYTAIVRDLDIPRPFDLGEFATRLERHRGRPILLRPFNSGPNMPCGLWIGTAEADYIYYENGTTPFHRTLIALHEIAHMLLGHRGLPAWQNLARQVAPDVHPSLVQLILSRSAYSTPEERDAETLASLILERATDWPARGPAAGSGCWWTRQAISAH